MDSVILEVQSRGVTGKAVKHLRKDGFVPGVIHDHGKDSVVVQIEYQAAAKAYRSAGKHHTVEVKADGHTYTALIKSVTYDPKRNTMTHIVLNAVNANQTVDAVIPVRPRFAEGNEMTPAERNSLIVLHNIESVEVEALPKNLPDFLEFDAEKLVLVGDHVTVADLLIPTGVIVTNEATQTLATVFEPSALQAANEDAGGDAEEGDEETVASEHESSAEEDTQKDEISPGGKEQKESKDQGQNPEKH